jgi:hypothetical protein
MASQAAVGGQKPAGLLQVVGQDVRPGPSLGPGNARRCRSVSPAAEPTRGWVRECRFCSIFEDEQALVQLT